MNKTALSGKSAPNLKEAIGSGIVSATKVNLSALNLAAPASNRVLWELAQNKTWLTAAEKLKIVSSSANDDVGSTGATVVTIYGLTSAYVLQSEDISMNGVAAVESIKEYIAFLYAEVKTDGGTEYNEGNITITDNAATGYLGYMPLGYNKSAGLFYTVPAGYELVISDVQFSETANKSSRFILWVKEYGLHAKAEKQQVLIMNSEQSEYYRVIPEKSDVWVSGYSTGGSGVISGQINGWLQLNS